MARNKPLPEYIREWHQYVEQHPERQGKDIHLLKKLIEKLLKTPGIKYDPVDVDGFHDFCALLRHKEGRWAGKPFELSIEQSYIAACLYGFKIYDPELEMEVRYFRELVLFVCRKWGKSTFISAMALFGLIADNEPAAQVWCVATTRTQAAIVYEAAKAFALDSDTLKKYVKTKRDRDNAEMLLFMLTKSFMKPGSKNSEGQDGLNPHVFIVDECHAIKNRNTYDVFSSAGGARAQPLGITISTFGLSRQGLFDGLLSRAHKVLKGDTDERMLPVIFRIDDDDDPDDNKCWIKANPGLGSHPTMSYLEGEYKKAKADITQWPSFLSKHLNRAANASVIYFDLAEVNGCAVDVNESDYRGKYAVGGVDLAETTDLCCATALIPEGGKFTLLQRYFIAAERLEMNSKTDKMAYETFKQTEAQDIMARELLTVCEGSFVRKADVTEWYKELRDNYGLIFWHIGYDEWHGKEWAQDMQIAGWPLYDAKKETGITDIVRMGSKTLSVPMKETKVLFQDKKIRYDKHNGLFRWCTDNTAAKIDANKNIQPDKARSKGRIDGYVSFLIAYESYRRRKKLFDEYQP